MDGLDYPWRKKSPYIFCKYGHPVNTDTLYGPLSVCIDRLWLRVQNYCLPDSSWPSWYLFYLRLTPVVKIVVTCNQPYQASLNCHYWYPQYGLPPQSALPEVAQSCSSQGWWTHPQGSFIQTIDNRSQESQAPCPAVHGRLQMQPQSMRNCMIQTTGKILQVIVPAGDGRWKKESRKQTWNVTSPESWRKVHSSTSVLHT